MLLRSKKRNMLLDPLDWFVKEDRFGMVGNLEWRVTRGFWSPVPESRGRVIISASDFHQSLQNVSDNVTSFRLFHPHVSLILKRKNLIKSTSPGLLARKLRKVRI